VYKEHPGARSGCPFKNFKARVNRKGDFVDFRTIVIYLETVEG